MVNFSFLVVLYVADNAEKNFLQWYAFYKFFW